MICKVVEIRLTIFLARSVKLFTDLLSHNWRISWVLGAVRAPPQYPPPSLEAGAERVTSTAAEAACLGEGPEPRRGVTDPSGA
jgi:hypothetical protein